jgi:hypothetical protein
MSNVNALLTQRLKKGEQSSKMAEMAKRSANGNLTTFAGMFSVSELNNTEKEFLETLLKAHALDQNSIANDLQTLVSLTAEVKAITNQAAILHGERIKKAHDLLLNYKDGAFTAWLIATYGNRQTPYNLMLYYDFYEALPKPLRPQIESMPRQAIYTLASREGEFERKMQFVKDYKGETKGELLIMIRETFPLATDDKRRGNVGEAAIQQLERVRRLLQRSNAHLNKSQKDTLLRLLDHLKEIVHE